MFRQPKSNETENQKREYFIDNDFFKTKLLVYQIGNEQFIANAVPTFIDL